MRLKGLSKIRRIPASSTTSERQARQLIPTCGRHRRRGRITVDGHFPNTRLGCPSFSVSRTQFTLSTRAITSDYSPLITLYLSLSLTDCNQHVPSNLQVSIDFRFHLDSLLKGISFSLVSAFDGLRWNIRCFCCTLHSAPYVKSSNSIVKPAVLSIILQRK